MSSDIPGAGNLILFDVCGGAPFVPTAIEDVATDPKSRLIYHNGQVLIQRNGSLYTLRGEMVNGQ